MEQMDTQTATDIATLFVQSYRSAFERYDTDAILMHFAYPAHFVSDSQAVDLRPAPTANDCRQGVEQIQAWHRAIGYAAGRLTRLSASPLSARMISVQLEFEIHDARGHPLYDFSGVYTLVRRDGDWKIAAISHNQVPRLLACVAAVRAEGEDRRDR